MPMLFGKYIKDILNTYVSLFVNKYVMVQH